MPNAPIKRIFEKFHSLNKRSGLIVKNDRLVVAVSGGPDSMALLYFLNLLRKNLNLTLVVVHVHHGLQKQNDSALKLVKKTTHEMGFKFCSLKTDALKYAKCHKRSLEEAGRILRYSFFEEVARKCRMSKIVTAHTQDDQAETLLLRIVRGSGLRGLTAIAPKRKQGNALVIRPLLKCSKKELLDFLKSQKISFLKDPTNQQLDFTRNRVRLKLIPWLEQNLNPAVKEALSDLQDSCEPVQKFLDKTVEQKLRRLKLKKKKTGVALSIPKIARFEPVIASELLHKLYSMVRGDGKGISAVHRHNLEDLIYSSDGDKDLSLPGRIRARRKKSWLWFEKLGIIPPGD